ncbi:hypothetical protein GCM10022250_23680 [Flavobacterium chungbukense]|uniref:HTH lacI-type domain-containing protein n=2 Tax=Flavobacterium chungbukense TaxID=877464 RepID=A0ABP7Y6M5_9FLAO
MVRTKDIAREADVSVMTVSFILNNKLDNNGIFRGLIEKIIKASKEMKFMPNMIPILPTGRTKCIWLIVEDISNPIFSDLAKIIERGLPSFRNFRT